jgi:hypothetical protein
MGWIADVDDPERRNARNGVRELHGQEMSGVRYCWNLDRMEHTMIARFTITHPWIYSAILVGKWNE